MPQIQYGFKKDDECYTPDYAVLPIVKYLKPNSKIWCPFDTEQSEFVKVLKDNGFEVVHTHICNGSDFFETNVQDCDYIISNPPYSLKTQIIDRLYDLGKPFAMLINFQGIFDSKKRFAQFKNHNFELMVLYPRINYIRNGKTEKGCPFQSGYICNGVIDKQIVFEYVQPPSLI